MGLFNKASIVMTPNGVKAGKVYSVKPSDGDGDFTFSRATVANKEASNGLIQETAVNVPRLDYSDGTCPALLLEPQSTNLITYPISFFNSYWTKSKASIQGSPIGDELVVNGSLATDLSGWSLTTPTGVTVEWTPSGMHIITDGTGGGASQSILTVGTTYVVDFDYEAVSGSLKLDSVINGLSETKHYRKVFVATQSPLTFYRQSGAAEGYISNVSVKEVQGFVSPDGTSNAYKLVEGINDGNHSIYSANTTVTLGVQHTISFYVKKGNRDRLRIEGGYRLDIDATFDLGLLTSTGGGKIDSLGSDWYRLSASGVGEISTGATNAFIYLLDDNGTQSYQGDGTSGIYIYGAQLEALPYATSLMLPAVEGSTVTRVADSCTNSGTPSDFGSAEGVLYAEIANITNGQDSRISISDGTLSNRASFAFAPTANEAYCLVRFNGVQVIQNLNLDLGFSQTNFTKVAVKYKSGQSSLFVNGVKVISSSVTFSPTSSDFTLSISGATGVPFYGKVRGVQVYKEALTDTELYDLTKPLYSTFDVMTNDLQYDTI